MSQPPAPDGRPLRQSLVGLVTVGSSTILACLMLVGLWALANTRVGDAPRLRVGVETAAESEPLTVARAHGVLEDTGVLVVEFGSGEDLRNAFLDGNVHTAIVPLDDALRLLGPPQEARVVRIVGASRQPWTLMTRRGGPTLAQLRGRRVGLESGRFASGVLATLLAPAGLDPAQVDRRLVDVDSAREMLETGHVDAVLVHEPERGEIAAWGGVEIARWTPAAAGEPLALVASARALKLAAAQVEQVEAAWDSGVVRLAKREASDVELMARRLEVTPAEVDSSLARVRFYVAEDDRRLRAGANDPGLVAALAAIEHRWRAIGIDETVPTPARWWSAGRHRP